MLLGAGAISMLLGDRVGGAAIFVIVGLNAVIGFLQELRAGRAIAALARLAAPRARVVREGRSLVVPAHELVRGDLVLVEAGDLVAADARLLEASALRTNEAALTGESQPVDKSGEIVAPDTMLAERRNLVFSGTSVVRGTGRAVVFATGMGTEIGRIAGLLEAAPHRETPLQRKLDALGRQLTWACFGIVLVVFALGWRRGESAFDLFLGAVSLAVAAVPEGLPAVVTVALALGMGRLARRNALMRSLAAVETLGETQVICSDKTGTLTLGAMTVRRIVTLDAIYRVGGEGYAPEGEITRESDAPALAALPIAFLHAAAACNDAELTQAGGAAGIVGDPTEAALLVAAAKAGIRREDIEREEARLRTLPFDAARKRMTIVRRRGDHAIAFVKGAPEEILERSRYARSEHGDERLGAEASAALSEACALLAADGLRVLAVAERQLASADDADVESDLTFLGLAGLQDPPRPEAGAAVARCRRAGIRTVMITGDHRDTAAAIARELGILGPGDEVVTGRELAELDDAALARRAGSIAVYARVSPEDKLRIVRAWKARGAVVAMTGDGVNDAPALHEASMGIAMGSGSEVAKEASDMILTDDDFASIVAAVEEGRAVFDNVAKTLSYLLAGNSGELIAVLGATLAGSPLPLLPVQLLWINLVTDGLPALALAADPVESDVLHRPPTRADRALADPSRVASLLLTGCLTAAVCLAAFALELRAAGDPTAARDAAFSTLVFAELLRAFGARSERKLLREIGLLTNLRLLAVVAASFVLQLAIHQTETLRRFFGIVPLTPGRVAVWSGLACVPLVALEAHKAWRRRRNGEMLPE